jgi:SLT domain-containing protein
VFSTVATFFKNTFESAWTAVKKVFSTGGKIFNGIKDGIVTAFKKIVNAIITGINKVVSIPFNAINKVLDKIRSVNIAGAKPFSNLGSISVPQIPQLAKGGIVNKATLAEIGEGKSAEAVIPLDKTLTKYIAEAMKETGESRNITVNFYPQKMTDAELDNAFNYINKKFGMSY